MDISQLEKEIAAIKERNNRVEADKAWETSWFRVILLTLIIYVAAAICMAVINVEGYLLGALVPAVGYFLSTRSLPFIKNWWIKRQ